jgi:hypothetical protein
MLVVAGFFDQGFFRGLLMLGIAFCWGYALFDLVRRPMKGWQKLIWFVVIIALPVLGTAIYILASPTAEIQAPMTTQDIYVDNQGVTRDPRPQMPHGGV